MKTKHPYWNRSRSALLIDLDNIMITRSGYLSAEDARAVLHRVLEAAGPTEWTLAVAPVRTIHHFAPLLAEARVRWQIVPFGRDVADAEIVHIAMELSAHGYARFVVASSDGYFAEISKFARLSVVSRAGKPVSRKLQAAATDLCAA